MNPTPPSPAAGSRGDVVVIGGGAAGFFAAVRAAEAGSCRSVTILEKGPAVLAKVRISGGGRCNVTHSCFEPRALAARYPRGGQALIGPFHRFQPRDTVQWFEGRGVTLKTEEDGRMFPVTDSSQTIIDCLTAAATAAQVRVRLHTEVTRLERRTDGRWIVHLAQGPALAADHVLLATGGARTAAQGQLPVALGHTLEPPVPSLFTFHLDAPWLTELSGLSVDPVELRVPGTDLKERGPLLITHKGVSGPVTLRLSAWGARALAGRAYQFDLEVNWQPGLTEDAIYARFEERRQSNGAKQLGNAPIPPLPGRLWERLVRQSGVRLELRWSGLGKDDRRKLAQQLQHTLLPVRGKTLNQDEFVTCGGVRLAEVDFKTMQSRKVPGLYFAGEALDIDGITGGFNFQAAWTTGWIAGGAMAGLSER